MDKIGIDKDHISLDTARHLKQQIVKEQGCQVILYQTKNGFHFELIFDRKVGIEEGFEIRERYGDCIQRLYFSRLRFNLVGREHDLLFAIKDGFARKRIWSTTTQRK